MKNMMKTTLAVAVLAAVVGLIANGGNYAGSAVFGGISCSLVASCSFAVALAAAGIAIWRLWRLIVKILHNLQTCAEKLTYMEHRMDKANAHIGDVRRHLNQMFAEFDPEKNEGKGDTKWWWCSRRCRELYAAFASSLMEKGAVMENVQTIWKMLQCEVQLRAIRDLAAERWSKLKSPNFYDAESEECHLHALKMMKAGIGKVDFWSPMKFVEVQGFECKSPWEVVLKAQILERHEELLQYQQDAGDKASSIFEGTGFKYGGSSADN